MNCQCVQKNVLFKKRYIYIYLITIISVSEEVVFAVCALLFSFYLMSQHAHKGTGGHFICLNLESRPGTTCSYAKLLSSSPLSMLRVLIWVLPWLCKIEGQEVSDAAGEHRMDVWRQREHAKGRNITREGRESRIGKETIELRKAAK